MLRVFRRLCGGVGRGGKEDEEKQIKMPDTQLTTEPKMAEISRLADSSRTIYQPLDASVRDAYDPEYVAFHDTYVQYVEPEHVMEWSPGIRSRSLWPYAGSPILEVGSVKDLKPCPDFAIRVFKPENHVSESQSPLVIWFHGGGFAGGNIDSDNDLCSLLCRDLSCVVVNVDYRLAPEHPYPAAVEDVVNILKWVSSESGAQDLGIDRGRIAIGGASAGANLATVGTLMAAELLIPLSLQLLVVPVTDNSATLETSWASHPHAAGLTPPRMTWYRNLYIKNIQDAKEWQISPLYASKEIMAKSPKTWIAIAGQDMLSTEGLAYAEKLRAAGVTTDVRIYGGMPHSMMAMSGVLRTGRQCMLDLVDAVRQHFSLT